MNFPFLNKIFKNKLFVRLNIGILLVLSNYVVLMKFLSFYHSLFLIATISFTLTIYFNKKDGVQIITTNEFIIGLLCILYFTILIVTYTPPKMSEIELILIRQSIFEEIIFRFFMIGVNKKYISKNTVKEAIIVLFSTTFIFTIFHGYDIWGNFQISLISLVFTYIFLNINIIPAIISHAIWNLYIENNIKTILLLPIMITTIVCSLNRMKTTT